MQGFTHNSVWLSPKKFVGQFKAVTHILRAAITPNNNYGVRLQFLTQVLLA